MSAWKVFLDGTDISAKVSNVRVSYSGGDISGDCEIELADRRGFGLLTRVIPSADTPLEVRAYDSNAEAWETLGQFLLEQITYPESMDAVTATLWGRSSQARLTPPWSARISKRWETSSTLFALVGEVCAEIGIEIDTGQYDFAIDVEGGTYTATNLSPGEIVQELATLAGYKVWPKTGGGIYFGPRDWKMPEVWQEPFPVICNFAATDIALNSVSRTMPAYGNRIMVKGDMPQSNMTVRVYPLLKDGGSVPADGTTKVPVLAEVYDEFGNLKDDVEVTWTCDEGSLAETNSTHSGENPPVVEAIRADSYTKATLRFHASSIIGVYTDPRMVPAAGTDPDPGAANIMSTKGGSVERNIITFTTDLDYFDQALWVRYIPFGAPNIWTAGTTPGEAVIMASVEGSAGQTTINQGVPTASNRLTLLGPKQVCFGQPPARVVILGWMFNAPATGSVQLSLEGGGLLSHSIITFGQDEVSEEVRVAGADLDGQRYIDLMIAPLENTLAVTDSAGQAVTATADPADARRFFVGAPLRAELTATYQAMGVAAVGWTPPALVAQHEPPPTEPLTEIEERSEWTTVYWDDVPPYLLGGQTAKKAAFVNIEHEPLEGYGITCFVEVRDPFTHNLVKRQYYKSHEGKKIRLEAHWNQASFIEPYTIHAAGTKCQVFYTREIVHPVPPSNWSYQRQPGISAEITATYADGSQTGVTANMSISARDCTLDAPPEEEEVDG